MLIILLKLFAGFVCLISTDAKKVLRGFFSLADGSESEMENSRDELIRRVLLENYESYYRLAFSYVHQEADAMDIVQEGAYRAMLRAGTLREERFAETWVYRIMINEAKEYLRKNRREYATVDENLAAEEVYGDIDLREAVDRLPDSERILIILRFYEDKELAEIAEILQENVSTVKSRLYRTLGKLREKLSVSA